LWRASWSRQPAPYRQCGSRRRQCCSGENC
jgi:hypothetical protein